MAVEVPSSYSVPATVMEVGAAELGETAVRVPLTLSLYTQTVRRFSL